MPAAIIENFKTILTKKYFCFEGRAGRAEFWYWFLACVIINIVLGIGDKFIGKPILAGLFSLATLLPYLGVAARRLHDTGKSGWLLLLGLIPFVGFIIVLLLCIPEGQKADNQYGPQTGAAPAADSQTGTPQN